jgi:hypothetical protein
MLIYLLRVKKKVGDASSVPPEATQSGVSVSQPTSPPNIAQAKTHVAKMRARIRAAHDSGLGRFVAGSSARAKARRLGISDEKQEAEERHTRTAELKPRRQTVRLLGRDIPVLTADDGTLRAEHDGKPASAKSVQSCIARAFGDRLGEARAAMESLAASLPPEELNRVGFRLYGRLRPDVREGAQWRGGEGRVAGGYLVPRFTH